ncbi:MAG: phenylalanyl-tRNA synthetase beta chain, partial [Pirellulaceae bacterium]
MKLSLEWIKDYVDLPAELGPTELGHDLTMATVEVEDVVVFADILNKVVVGVIKEIKSHPDADQLSVCSVDVGTSELQDIVCGGSNVAAGMKVAVALVGSKVKWHGEGDLVELKPTKIRGVQSDGMICASTEIGLGNIFPLKGEKEILDISQFEIAAGQPLVDALDLNDVILDIDNKSLTNRPDLWGHYGVARELAALYNLKLKPLPTFSFDDTGNLTVEIESEKKCRRYSATQINGVEVEESPFWLRSRLARVGQRPINLLVDLTNYVMFSLGQPCHAFDSTRVNGTISVRDSKPGERIELLDGNELELTKEDLLIADGESSLALAGVMGGARCSVFPDTKNIILEFAHFEAIGIRRTASRCVRTESSTRFEKSLDPAMVSSGVAMFIDLLKSIQKDAEVTAHVDAFPLPVEPQPIVVTTEFLHWRLGKAIEEEKIIALFQRLGFSVSADSGTLTVTPPTWRSTGDVSLAEDLVEEVARLYGYEEFEFVAPEVALEGAIDQPRYQTLRNIKRFLANNAGMYEVMNYPWVHERFLKATGFDKDK